MNQRTYQICSNCIMDTTDSTLTFDERGWCDYCRNFYKNILPNWHPNEEGVRSITPLIEKIKKEGKGCAHDCSGLHPEDAGPQGDWLPTALA